MTKLSPEKRNQLILVAMITVMVLAALWFLAINAQRNKLGKISQKILAAEQSKKKMQAAVNAADKIEADLKVATQQLATIEEGMAYGDLLSWMVETIKTFKRSYRVDLPQFGTGAIPSPVTLLPRFPYQQVTLGVGGTAYFHDLGKFLADLENKFPYIRVQNLELYPDPALAGGAKEKLAFRMEVIALIKPTTQ